MSNQIQLIVPETIILQAVESILAFIERDFNANIDETKTVLYRILNQDIALQRIKFYEQSKKIFITAIDHPRKISVNLGFNMQRNGLPTLHIINPDDRQSANNGINIDEGYQDPIYDSATTLYRQVYSRRFDANLKIIFTSDNTNEVIIAYHLLRALLIPAINHLTLAGLEQCSLSGGDIAINDQLAPLNIYMKELVLNFSYDVNVQGFYDEQYINALNFIGNLVDESESN